MPAIRPLLRIKKAEKLLSAKGYLKSRYQAMIGAKVPGAGMTIRTVHMDFLYGGAFREGVPEAYEKLKALTRGKTLDQR